MERGNIKLKNPEWFTDGYKAPKEKLQKALHVAVKKLRDKAPVYKDGYPRNLVENNNYLLGENNNWVHGMHTGNYILAYEATGDKFFLDIAKYQLKSYEKRIKEDVNLNDHDVGFVYSPSCVAYYKVTGDQYAKDLALKAADILYDRSYSEKGGFIMRFAGAKDNDDESCANGCRTMMDTMMNIPLFFWASEEIGNEKFKKAALSQCKITADYLIREDASSNHHYQFEVGTCKPLYGITLQGNRNKSTWSRGHSWGVIGYPIAYNYSAHDYMLPLHRDITYYFLNNLPDDFIPYWDFDFISGDEPRDSSAAAIAVCGMLEAARVMPYTDEEKLIFVTAANKMIESIIDKYTTTSGEEYAGLLTGVTPARKMEQYPTNTSALYGDYFYLEALVRLLYPDWKRYW